MLLKPFFSLVIIFDYVLHLNCVAASVTVCNVAIQIRITIISRAQSIVAKSMATVFAYLMHPEVEIDSFYLLYGRNPLYTEEYVPHSGASRYFETSIHF